VTNEATFSLSSTRARCETRSSSNAATSPPYADRFTKTRFAMRWRLGRSSPTFAKKLKVVKSSSESIFRSDTGAGFYLLPPPKSRLPEPSRERSRPAAQRNRGPLKISPTPSTPSALPARRPYSQELGSRPFRLTPFAFRSLTTDLCFSLSKLLAVSARLRHCHLFVRTDSSDLTHRPSIPTTKDVSTLVFSCPSSQDEPFFLFAFLAVSM